MGVIEVCLIGVGLSMDALAVAIVASVTLARVTGSATVPAFISFRTLPSLDACRWMAGRTDT